MGTLSTEKFAEAWRTALLCMILYFAIGACNGDATPSPSAATSAATSASSPLPTIGASNLTPAPSQTTPQPTNQPTNTAPCATPNFVGSLELAPMPSPVLEPHDMTTFKGRTYVVGRLNATIGIIENDRLVETLLTRAMPSPSSGGIAIFADEALGKLFVLHGRDNAIAMFDGRQLQATIPISNPTKAYQSVAAMVGDAQNHRLYVGLSANVSEVVVVDTQAFTVTARLVLGADAFSIGALALDAPNQRLFVSTAGNTIVVWDLRAQKIIDTYKLNNFTYRVLLYDQARRRLYHDFYDNGGYIGVIENGRRIAAIPVGADTAAGVIVRDRLYVSNSFSNTVSVIDLQTHQPIATIAVSYTPRALLPDAKGERLYVAIAGSYRDVHRLDIIDTQRNVVVGHVPLAITPRQLIADATRTRLYALSPSLNAIIVSDGQRTLAQIPLEGTPTWMDFDELAGRFYVADYLTGEVTMASAARNQIIERKLLRATPRVDGIAVDRAHNRVLVNNRAYALGTLAPTGAYSITGYTVPYGDGIYPDRLLVNPSAPRFYAIAWNGVPGSNSGMTFYMFDSDALKQINIGGERNVTAYALDDQAQRLYVAYFHPLGFNSALHVYDAVTFNRLNVLPLPARVMALGLNRNTSHLFMAYGDTPYARPSPADQTIEVLDTRTLGRVASFPANQSLSSAATLNDRLYFASALDNHLTIVRDCASALPPAPTPTSTPTPYPTFPPPSPTPTPTRVPPTATPRITPTPLVVSCPIAVANWLKPAYDSNSLYLAIACPKEAARNVTFAEQAFQNGTMLWREDVRQIYVLWSNNRWNVYPDTWTPNEPEGGAETPPRADLRAPKRGFGKVWRDQLGGATSPLGWALEDERGAEGQAQSFERGVVIRSDTLGMRVLHEGGAQVTVR